MKHAYVVGPFVTAQGKLVFSDNLRDILTFDSADPFEVLAADVGQSSLIDFFQKYRIEFTNGGIGFDIDYLDAQAFDVLRRISKRLGWPVVMFPQPTQVCDTSLIEGDLNERAEKRRESSGAINRSVSDRRSDAV